MERPTKKRRGNELLPSRDESDTASASSRQLAGFDAEMMQQQLELFVRSGDAGSAQILGELLVSVALFPSDSEAHSSRSDAHTGSDEMFLSRRAAEHFEASANDIQTLTPVFHAKTLRLFADLMLAKREFKRAIVSCTDLMGSRSWRLIGVYRSFDAALLSPQLQRYDGRDERTGAGGEAQGCQVLRAARLHT